MSCHFRHISKILDEVGIEVTPANKKQFDQAIHQIAGITYKNCPDT
jgi:molecular chaperone GrpE (heat shock protein)